MQYWADNPESLLWMWAKQSAWSADTGGETDEHGAPRRAQTGIWLEMWESVVAAQQSPEALAGASSEDQQEDVPMLAAPRRILEWLGALLVPDASSAAEGGEDTERSATVLVKALDVLKGLVLADMEFKAGVQSKHAVSVGSLQQYHQPSGVAAAATAGAGGGREDATVRRAAVELYEELFPDARAVRLRREAAEAEEEAGRKKEAASLKGKVSHLRLGFGKMRPRRLRLLRC